MITNSGLSFLVTAILFIGLQVVAQSPQLPDLIPYRKGNKWGYCDRNKKIVTACIYDAVTLFTEDLAAVELYEKYGFINKNGTVIVPFKYSYVTPFSEGLAAVYDQKLGKYGYIDKTGEEVIPPTFSGIPTKLNEFKEGMAMVCIEEKYGFIYKNGKVAIPCQYEFAQPFSEGLACVKLNGKWGFIDKTGKIVIQCEYERCESFQEGLALVAKNNQEFFIDYHGNIKISIANRYPDLEVLFSSFYNGKALMLARQRNSFDGKISFIDKKGNITLKTEFYSIATHYFKGYAAIMVPTNDPEKPFNYGLIDSNGKIILEPGKYSYPTYVGNNLIYVETNDGQDGYVDIFGNEYWDN